MDLLRPSRASFYTTVKRWMVVQHYIQKPEKSEKEEFNIYQRDTMQIV